MAVLEDFQKIDIRTGTVIKAEVFNEAKKPAYKLWIDFGGEIGIKKSSAQITEHYSIEDLQNKQVFAVVNFPERQIANFMSEVLVLGVDHPSGGISLIRADHKVGNGVRLK
ncbi:MAG: tRNA-binding protein [Chitinophagales bacterium]